MLVCKSKPHQDRRRYRRGFSSGRNRVHQGWSMVFTCNPVQKEPCTAPGIGVGLIMHRP